MKHLNPKKKISAFNADEQIRYGVFDSVGAAITALQTLAHDGDHVQLTSGYIDASGEFYASSVLLSYVIDCSAVIAGGEWSV